MSFSGFTKNPLTLFLATLLLSAACAQAADQVQEDIEATGEVVEDTTEDVHEAASDPQVDDQYEAHERVEDARARALRHEGAARPAHDYAVAVVDANRENAYKQAPRPDDQTETVTGAIEKAAEAQPDEAAYLWLDAGRVYHTLGRPDPALEAFRRAWEAKPTASAAYGLLELDPDATRAICKKTLEHVPDERERVRFLAACAAETTESSDGEDDESTETADDSPLEWAPDSARELYRNRAPAKPWRPPGVCGAGCAADRHYCIRSCDSSGCLEDCSGTYRACMDDCVSPSYDD